MNPHGTDDKDGTDDSGAGPRDDTKVVKTRTTIFIKVLHGKSKIIDVEENEKVGSNKETVYKVECLPIHCQLLPDEGKIMQDEMLVKHSSIVKDDTIWLTSRIR